MNTPPPVAGLILTFAILCPRLFAGFIPEDPRWTHAHQLGFRPADGSAAEVNPPRFSWSYLPVTGTGSANPPASQFRFELAQNAGFSTPIVSVLTERNFHNALAPLAAGTWYWRVGYDTNRDGIVDQWGATRSFSVASGTPAWDRSGAAGAVTQLTALPRPRLGPAGGDWSALRAALQANPRQNAWLNQVLGAANAIVAQSWFANPNSYFPNTDDDAADGAIDGKVTFSTPSGSEQWSAATFGSRGHDLATVAFAHKVTGNAAYAGARDILLRIAAFPSGSRTLSWPEYNGSSNKQSTPIAEFLALAYDWYYAELNATQRALLVDRVRQRVEQTLFNGRSWRSGGAGAASSDAYYNGVGLLGDSHPYQNLMWTIPAALLIAGENPTHDAHGCVPLLLDFLNGVTSSASYGHDDGGVNEGAGYAGEKQGAMLRAALATRLMLPGLAVEKNPYLPGYQRFYSHLIPTDYDRIPFGDQWSYRLDETALTENMRLLVLLTGDGRAKSRWEALAADNSSDTLELGGFSRPWTVLLAERAFGSVVPSVAENRREVFTETGWVFAGSQPPTTRAHAQSGVRMSFQSRPRGAQSHSYNAENTFAWYAFGQTLAAGGGGRTFGDPYAKDSLSHNVLLVDGKGQGWANAGAPSVPYMGRLLSYTEGPWYMHWVGDATNAYRENGVPLKRWHRHVIFVDEAYFVVYDDVELQDGANPATFSWLLQADSAGDTTVSSDGFNWSQAGVNARVVFAAPPGSLSILRRTGNDIFTNLVTGAGSLAEVSARYLLQGNLSARPTYDDAYPPADRTLSQMWVSTASRQTQWGLMSALLAWNAGTAPVVTTLNDRAMTITHSGRTRTLSFNPATPGDLLIDLLATRLHAGEAPPGLPLVSVAFDADSRREGEPLILRFVRSENLDSPLDVDFSAGGSATRGIDYAFHEARRVRIPANVSVLEVPVFLHDDSLPEPSETVLVTLVQGGTFRIGTGSAALTIVDNDTVSVDRVDEEVGPSGTASIPIEIRNPSSSAQSVSLAIVDPPSHAHGYVWNSSDRHTAYPEVPAFEWVDVPSLPGARVNAFQGADDARTTSSMNLGFSFPYFTTTHTQINAMTNGFAMFTNGSFDSNFINRTLPYAHSSVGQGELSLIPYWTDLYIYGDGAFYYAQLGPDTFAMQWDNVGFYGKPETQRMTFQILLRRDGRITFNYRDHVRPTGPLTVQYYTIGLQNHERDKAIQAAYSPYGVGSLTLPIGTNINYSIRFWRQPAFVVPEETSVLLQPGEARTLRLNLVSGTLFPGETYHAAVRVQGSVAGLLREIPVSLSIRSSAIPQMPRRLRAQIIDASRIDLEWDDLASGETGYEVQRATTPTGPYQILAASLPADAAAFSDLAAAANNTIAYHYRVRALGASGASDWTDPVVAGGTAPAAPFSLIAEVAGVDLVSLSWSATGARYYVIERSDEGAAFLPVAYTDQEGYTDVLTGPGRSYAYRLVAVNHSGASAPGPVRQITLAAPVEAAIQTHPASVRVELGQTAMLAVQATGDGLGYQWYRGASGDVSQPIAGAVSASYTTSALSERARFWVRVQGTSGGPADSNTAVVDVNSLIAYEGFGQPFVAGTSLHGLGGGTGFGANLWNVSGNTVAAVATGLAHTIGGQTLTTTQGGAERVANGGFAEAYRDLAANTGAGEIWLSFLLQMPSGNHASDGLQFNALGSATGRYYFFNDGSGNLKCDIQTVGGSGARVNVGTTSAFSLSAAPVLVVARLTLGTADDTYTVYVDPANPYDIPGSARFVFSTRESTVAGGGSVSDIGRIHFRSTSRINRMDEIRIARNASSVVPIPLPAAPLTITSSPVFNLIRGATFDHALTASLTGVLWTVVSALPDWITLSADRLSGSVPNNARPQIELTLRAVSGAESAEQTLVLNVDNALNLTAEEWRVLESLPAGIAANDTDGDGVVDLLEYAIGGNPRLPDTHLLPALEPYTAGGVRFIYRRRPGQEARYQMQASADLATWNPAAPDSVALSDLADGFTQVTAHFAPVPAGARLFLRLAVTE